ncbi:hypothetical protein CO251_09680 [Sulfobacillus sp. hq2]|nr:hypothetical protein CO251_09680 [Sulfobacillus sp. hq2]
MVYDIKGNPVASDIIPPKTSRDYRWVFIIPPSEVSINNDTRYDLTIQLDRGRQLKDEVPARESVAAVNEG